jgi:adhesin/invasin
VTDTSGVHFAGNSVIITANIVATAGGTVPAGTPVTFAVTSGTGTLSSTTATTDANGNASVTLSSTAEGNVTVTVTAAQATGSHPVVFTDPNKPAAINLVTNRISGVINNLGAVTLTATLTPQDSASGSIADGTPVTFTILTGADGTLSSATAFTTGGVASVTLNSSVVGNISVNATAGSSPVVTSNTVFVPFVNPTTVTVKVRTTGTLPLNTTIGGIEATVSASPSTGLSIASDPNGVSSDVSATGAGAGSTLITNSNNVAAVKLALINTGGIQTGEFATLTYHVAAGSFPTANDFSISLGIPVIDTGSNNIPGIGVALSVTIQ